jgi:hypothetical protein
VAVGGLVEGGADDLAAHGALHFGHFFRALVDQQDDQVDLGVVGDDGVRDVLVTATRLFCSIYLPMAEALCLGDGVDVLWRGWGRCFYQKREKNSCQ